MFIEKTCEYCGVLFRKRVDVTQKYRFCSRGCHYAWSSARVQRARQDRTPSEIRKELVKYFNERVARSNDGCWIWTGQVSKHSGYGRSDVDRKRMDAHRFSWMLHRGELSASDMVMHLCDNKACVNPDHLILSWTMIKKICCTCKKEYEVAYYRKNKNTYCSRKCAGMASGHLSSVKRRERWESETYDQYIRALRISLERFIFKTDGCWEWTAHKKSSGYGGLSFRGKVLIASRASWMVYVGEIPEGRLVLHRCDNPSCVNPEHLFIGTHLDNARDKIKKKRGHKHSLTPSSVKKIRKSIRAGVSMARIAKDYGVSHTSIKNIKYGKTWKDV